MNTRIEVGDTFTCDGQGDRELIAIDVDARFVRFELDGKTFFPIHEKCHLVRRAVKAPNDCHWVKPGWFIQPDDFNVEGVVADTYGSAWICCTTPNTWIRRNLRHPELQHIKRKAGDAAKVLDTMGDGLNAHKMKWAIHQAAKEYAKKLEQIEAECKRIASEGKSLAGQP